MNTLTAFRRELQTALTGAGFHAFAHVPEVAVPPAAVVEYGSPLIEIGESFTRHIVNFRVLVLSDKGTNETESDELDTQIVAAMRALKAAGWHVTEVEKPQKFTTTTGAEYLGTYITVNSGEQQIKENTNA